MKRSDVTFGMLNVLMFAEIGCNNETLRDIIMDGHKEMPMHKINDMIFRLMEHITESNEFRQWCMLEAGKLLVEHAGGLVVDEFGDNI